jgi:hypothetical protein
VIEYKSRAVFISKRGHMKKPGQSFNHQEEKFLRDLQAQIQPESDLSPRELRAGLEFMLATRQLVQVYVDAGWINDARRLENQYLKPEWHIVDRMMEDNNVLSQAV